MSSLAQIERVLFLQEVELFAHCTAAQIVRIAAIASEERFTAGDVVYSVNDPSDSIYCVVEGGVKLENPSHQTVTVGEKASFGVLDILSGRLRSANATAEDPTLTLAIDAEDFFDLLSNNIDIVKALVRFLSERASGPMDL